jgi:hypothetical protein
MVFYQDLFIKLNDYDDPLKGQVTVVDFIEIPELLDTDFRTSLTLALNNAGLTDNNFM